MERRDRLSLSLNGIFVINDGKWDVVMAHSTLMGIHGRPTLLYMICRDMCGLLLSK